MIRNSDNAATDTLLAQIGVSTCQRVADQLGMSSTVVRGGSTGWWGHSTTTPRDLVQLMNQLVLGTYLTSGRRAYVRDLMASVTSTQRWGLGDPLPDAVHVEQKNGWGPMASGYRMNSFGFVSGYGRSYQLAILSKSPNGFSYGKTTINKVSRIVYDALDRYADTRVGTIGLTLRDNRDGGYFAWQPLTLQSLSTIKVLILVATLKRA